MKQQKRGEPTRRLEEWREAINTDVPRLSRWIKLSVVETQCNFDDFGVDPDWQAFFDLLAAVWNAVLDGAPLPAAWVQAPALLQGCPVSPLCLNSMMVVWLTAAKKADTGCTLSVFLDDRAIWVRKRRGAASAVQAAMVAGREADKVGIPQQTFKLLGVTYNSMRAVPIFTGAVGKELKASLAARTGSGGAAVASLVHLHPPDFQRLLLPLGPPAPRWHVASYDGEIRRVAGHWEQLATDEVQVHYVATDGGCLLARGAESRALGQGPEQTAAEGERVAHAFWSTTGRLRGVAQAAPWVETSWIHPRAGAVQLLAEG
ncbi:hypothetical protein AK812_SmicGene31259 [Symbiodinium microadriaticum]|uniref:Reverse transcriptase domain-containing protein n=1 Tax=Symbiodinium microadriaticum TaxID=2951 RepID=A0A1Q9CX52_SYMMI|nr:hypothetical protein AK812_SmicGene31259 [Symbiodinium microadriaticum]